MNLDETIKTAEKFLKEGDMMFALGNYEASIKNLRMALYLSSSITSKTDFNKLLFEALCNSSLSGAFGKIGQLSESLTAAESALIFFDESGILYPTEIDKWIIAKINRGITLIQLNRFREALDALLSAKKLIAKTRVESVHSTMIDHNINILNNMLEKNSSTKWWRFWS